MLRKLIPVRPWTTPPDFLLLVCHPTWPKGRNHILCAGQGKGDWRTPPQAIICHAPTAWALLKHWCTPTDTRGSAATVPDCIPAECCWDLKRQLDFRAPMWLASQTPFFCCGGPNWRGPKLERNKINMERVVWVLLYRSCKNTVLLDCHTATTVQGLTELLADKSSCL